jgi:hypothetical protein
MSAKNVAVNTLGHNGACAAYFDGEFYHLSNHESARTLVEAFDQGEPLQGEEHILIIESGVATYIATPGPVVEVPAWQPEFILVVDFDEDEECGDYGDWVDAQLDIDSPVENRGGSPAVPAEAPAPLSKGNSHLSMLLRAKLGLHAAE